MGGKSSLAFVDTMRSHPVRLAFAPSLWVRCVMRVSGWWVAATLILWLGTQHLQTLSALAVYWVLSFPVVILLAVLSLFVRRHLCIDRSIFLSLATPVLTAFEIAATFSFAVLLAT